MSRTVCIIGIPMDLGQSRRGVDMGPSAVRYAGLDNHLRGLGYTVEDCGNLKIPVRDQLPGDGGMDFLPAVVETCEAVYAEGQRVIDAGAIPLFLGGDHSIALGTVAAATRGDGSTGVLWIDAHGDFNTPQTSPTGNLHGMPLAALTGRGDPAMVDLGRPGAKVRAQDVMLIGIRSLDPQEQVELGESGAGIYSMREIDERGIAKVANEALDRLRHCARIHVSLDMDCLDPREAPGVGTPVRGGVTYREAHLLMEIIAERALIASADVVEINPILDERNRTATLAIDLVASLLGRDRASA